MNKWDKFFMKTAEITAQLSSCERLKVGAVAVRNTRIICIGYNGTPEGYDNCCEHIVNDEVLTKPEVSHAERNLIEYAAKEGISLNNSSMYLTHSPCIECAKSIKNAGINLVVWKDSYRLDEGIKYLNKYKVKNGQYKENL